MNMPRIGIATMIKNEGSYLLEWIAHHKAIGADRIIIADNNSSDDGLEMLSKLHAAGAVEAFQCPAEGIQHPQVYVYRELVKRAEDLDWLAFIDADEFLLPTTERTLHDIVCHISQNEKVGAITCNWAIYGSSGLRERTQGLVTERFIRHATREFGENHHYKTLLRLSAYESPSGIAHHFELKSGFIAVHADGSEMQLHARGEGLSDRVVWNPLRVNHYVVKSMEEFHIRSQNGSVNDPGRRKGDDFFKLHDRNDSETSMNEGLLKATRVGVLELSRIISRPKTKSSLTPPQGESGWIDWLRISRDFLTIGGWSFFIDGLITGGISVRLGDKQLDKLYVTPRRRADVVKVHAGLSDLCGFEVICARRDGHSLDALKLNSLTLEVATPRGSGRLRLNPALANFNRKIAMPYVLAEFYSKTCLQSRLVLEYGAGGSTFFCAANEIPIFSVESDEKYAGRLIEDLRSFCWEEKSWKVVYVDIGETKAHGHPVDDSRIGSFPEYALRPWREGVAPDLVLIDGRFRVACLIATLAFTEKPVKVIFDDYVDRSYYHVAEDLITPMKIIDRAAYFEILPNSVRPRDFLKYLNYFFDPR